MTEVDGSNVREGFVLMSTLIYGGIPLEYLDRCAKILQPKHMETVFEERSVQGLCGFPPCSNQLPINAAKYRVSLARKEIYDAQHENKFCSSHCLEKAKVFASKLATKPPQLVPSLREVFGSDRPNPFQELPSTNTIPTNKSASVPKAKTIWSKTDDLGIVERSSKPSHSSVLSVPPSLSSKTPMQIQENESKEPDRSFPDASQAVNIEGFVFPSHKQRMAKKVEALLQKDGEKEEELVVSDSDESDAESEGASSVSSFDISDCDDEEEVTIHDLPHFANLWRMMSSWITQETQLLSLRLPLPEKEEGETEKVNQHVRVQRWNALSVVIHRPLPVVAKELALSTDRYVMKKFDHIAQSFALREAVDSRNAHQWTCIAALVLLAAHGKRPEDVTTGDLGERTQKLLKLDAHEVGQLMSLFYDLPNADEIPVDTDVAPIQKVEIIEESADTSEEDDTMCRKCKRRKAKCICKQRKQETDELTSEELEKRLQEALVVRKEYEEFLDAVE